MKAAPAKPARMAMSAKAGRPVNSNRTATVAAAPTAKPGASQRSHRSSRSDSIGGSAWYSIYMAVTLPDANAIGRGKIQFLSGLRFEGLVPRVHVPDDVGPERVRRVRVRQQALAKVRLAVVAPPYLRPAEVEALIRGHAIDDWRGSPVERRDVRVVGYRQTGQVGDILTHG